MPPTGTGLGSCTPLDWICDIGAHPSAARPSTNVLNAALMACGAYRIPAIYGRNRLAVTNTVPTAAYRGAGRPDMAYDP